MERIVLSKKGYERLQKELDYLKSVKKKEISERIKEAREQGDLSENAEYHAARQELAIIISRIEELETLLEMADIIETSEKETVDIGATVVIEDLITGKKKEYTFVASKAETDVLQGIISITSELGKSLKGKKVGEEVNFVAPSGNIKKYRILEIRYDV